uniref:Uncharacterized protein n=1 Tax=Ditylenchus dipsaci TaxID=166011 RepID=A0A915EHS1_9BILA
MLFLNNRPLDVGCDTKYGNEECTAPKYLQKITIVLVATDDDNNLWFCSIASTIGALGNEDSPVRVGNMASQINRPNREGSQEDNYTHFFIVLLIAEVVVLIIVGCLRCNLGPLKTCFRQGG